MPLPSPRTAAMSASIGLTQIQARTAHPGPPESLAAMGHELDASGPQGMAVDVGAAGVEPLAWRGALGSSGSATV